ncbi:Bulb-type lectin domain-containing protein [Heracleum sosnowskyi]|uniref:Bulb-type lectin domain-containing protein n=1 Tax=Heracleum sosnowskyi TaxID=360622 RepID=A0AAD8IUC6_9APIA|nr:Bulb-type lectin domain-containing protein [Heracleum sosnowskyi]
MEVLIIILICYSCLLGNLIAEDIIPTNGVIKDGETIVSPQGNFELGFFSPGNSQNRYLGIWYKKVSSGTVVWVANRNAPLQDKSGVLTVTTQGILALIANVTNTVIWSSNSSSLPNNANPVAQLLDVGNLVVKQGNGNNVLWQSFDYPTDTLLPGMQFGIDRKTGLNKFIASWKNNDDPAEGVFKYRCDPQGYPQFFMTDGSTKSYRLGSWNGITFSGVPRPGNNIYKLDFTFNEEGIYYIYEIANSSIFSRFVPSQNGVLQRKIWIDQNKGWVVTGIGSRVITLVDVSEKHP